MQQQDRTIGGTQLPILKVRSLERRRELRGPLGYLAAWVAALSYSSFLLSPLTSAGMMTGRGFVSELEASGTAYAWLYRSLDVVAGLSIIVLVFLLWRSVGDRRRARVAMILLGLVGLSSIVDGITSMRCNPTLDRVCAAGEGTVSGLFGQLTSVHTDTGLIGFAGAGAAAILLGAVLMEERVRGSVAQLSAGVAIAVCGLVDLLLLLAHRDLGAVERIRILITSAWFLLLGHFLSVRGRSIRTALSPSKRRPKTR